MNWKEFQLLVSGLLANDIEIPFDTGVSIELLRKAMWTVAETSDTQTLKEAYTAGTTIDILRQHGKYDELYIRKFKLPTKDSDKIDIDDLLIFAVAHYYVSYISSSIDLKVYHETKAVETVAMFNQKIKSFEERQEQVRNGN
jgi:hypothetical protein